MKRIHAVWISALLALGVCGAMLGAAVAASDNPLADMSPVEASKGQELPEPTSDAAAVRQGRYLVGLLGCASCHTDGALIGRPDPAKTLAGSSVGIAYTDPMVDEFPGAVYPANLTPDDATGLGKWSEAEIVKMLRSGTNRHGRQTMAIMPWMSYAQLSESDAVAIARYLKSLPAVEHRVPVRVLPGNPTRTPLVHVGLYRSK